MHAAPHGLEDRAIVNRWPILAAAERLRRQVLLLARKSVRLPDHLAWLDDHGFSREDSRQIRYVVEVFHNIEPLSAVLLALGVRPGGWWLRIPIALVEDDGSPSTHPFFRALAVWPEYSAMALEQVAQHSHYPDLIHAAAEYAELAACRLRAHATFAHHTGPVTVLSASAEAMVLASSLREAFIENEGRSRRGRLADLCARVHR
jgi:hypothetical protein